MKRYFATLLVMAFAAGFTQQASARININVRYDNYREYLDLQAVATAFSRADNIEEFEYRLNDPRDLISNLDLNNDGFVDYLRVEQYSERHEHVIYIQAVLARNYYQTVATIYVGRDRFNDEYIQIVGDESIYGYNYIIEPVFRRRPVIVRWLWTWNSPRYISPYSWGYYPRHYRVHHIIALPAYHHRVNRYVDHRHEYRRIEKDNRRADRDNRGQVDRRPDNRGYREADRRDGNQRIQNDGRNDRRPEVQRSESRQPERTQPRQPEVQRSETRQPERTQPRQPEVTRPENRQPEVTRPEVRRQDSNPTRPAEVQKSNSNSSRETVRESKSSPQRSAPASSGNSRTSERSSGNDTKKGERR